MLKLVLITTFSTSDTDDANIKTIQQHSITTRTCQPAHWHSSPADGHWAWLWTL